MAERVIREIEVLARLDHPHITSALGYARWDANLGFIVGQHATSWVRLVSASALSCSIVEAPPSLDRQPLLAAELDTQYVLNQLARLFHLGHG